MERGCFILWLDEGKIADYRRDHDVWPEMLDALRQAGVRNYSIFLRSDGMLIGYLEGADVRSSLAQLGKTDVNRRWQEKMAPYFKEGSGDLETGGLEWVEQIFYLP